MRSDAAGGTIFPGRPLCPELLRDTRACLPGSPLPQPTQTPTPHRHRPTGRLQPSGGARPLPKRRLHPTIDWSASLPPPGADDPSKRSPNPPLTQTCEGNRSTSAGPPPPMVSIAPTKVTTTKAGSSAQNSTSGVTSNPGHERKGTPTHCASSNGCRSNNPKGTDTAQPTAMPITGAHSRNAGGARSTRDPTTTVVASAAAGAAVCEVPSGTSVNEAKTIGMTVAAISMITVPATTVVNILRSSESRAASAN